MKGVGRLVKNELIKVFRQLSWKIITIVVLVFAVLNPLLSALVDSSFMYMDNAYEQWYDEAPAGSIEKEYYGACVNVEKFFSENGITYDDWRYEAYYYDYDDLAMLMYGLELVTEGWSVNEVFNWFYGNDISYEYDEETGAETITYYDEEAMTFVPLTEELAVSVYESKKAQLAEMEEQIKNGTVASYAETYITSLKMQMEEKTVLYDNAKMAYEADSSKVFEYQAAAYDLYATKTSLAVWEEVKTASREEEEWLIATGQRTLSYCDYGTGVAAVDKDTFEKDSDSVKEYGSYDNYVKLKGKQYYDRIAALDILKHSAKTRNPLPDVYTDSIRNTVETSIISNATFTMFFCMILAATIVASEHMTGTIRLLVIRPRARWKILLSKLLCVVVYGLAVFAASSVLSIVTALIVSGAGDLSLPYLIYRHGAVKEISPVIYIIAKTLVSVLPSLLIMTLAFMFSVVTKKVVFAVAIPMMFNVFGSVASTLTMLFSTRLPFLKWTLLPYFMVDSYTQGVVTRTSGYYMYDFVSMGFELEIGVVLFLLHIAIFTAVSFLVFRRQQIKN